MTLLIELDDIRAESPELLETDGILDAKMTKYGTRGQEFIFNMLAVGYDESEFDADFLTAYPIVKNAILQYSAGLAIVNEYATKESLVKLGESFKADAKSSINNILKGDRKLKNATKQETSGTITNSIVFADDSTMETRIDDFIDEMLDWDE